MSTRKLVIVLIIFATALIIGFVFQVDREKKLKNTKITKAVVIDRDKHHIMGFGVNVKFKVGNKEYFSKTPECDCKMLDIGDTILIKYAIEDPKIIKIQDKYYMQKYKSKK